MTWLQVFRIALWHEIEQNGRAIAGGIGGLALFGLFVVLAFLLGGR